MTNKELIARLSSKSNLSKQEIEQILDSTIMAFTSMLVAEKTIGIQSFGNFEIKKKEERLSVHPSTQRRTLIPPKLVVNFRQSNVLKDKLNENQEEK
jgi:DNA-binding protein HU-beta